MSGEFVAYMERARAARALVVQPRMGMGHPEEMRAGLAAVKAACGARPRMGTITVDAYSRVGRADMAMTALKDGSALNGYPITGHATGVTLSVLEGLRDGGFPVQVRHGSAFPLPIFEAAAKAGIDGIEGGPVSYNLPYSRARLTETTRAWGEAVRFWSEYGEREGRNVLIESFGGCMLGQLAPPSILVALSILEGRFFRQNGVCNIALSLSQGTNSDQDVGALLALCELCARHFGAEGWHVVYYTFMGLFPRSLGGARALIAESARIAVKGGAHRLIVKTEAEATEIPTVDQNVGALLLARRAADEETGEIGAAARDWSHVVVEEADRIVGAVLALSDDVGEALIAAFSAGILDVPYCLHPDNRNWARSGIDRETRATVWTDAGRIPLDLPAAAAKRKVGAQQFHDFLNENRNRYDLSTSMGDES